MAQDYYANKYGIQLEEFLIWGSEWDLKFWQYNFTTGQGFALTNALKYSVRAGKSQMNRLRKTRANITIILTWLSKWALNGQKQRTG